MQVRWGDYELTGEPNTPSEAWKRTAQSQDVVLRLKASLSQPEETKVPNSDGLRIAMMIRPVGAFGADAGLPAGARTVSVFLVNNRPPARDLQRDEPFAFQTELEISADAPLLARPACAD